MCVASKFEYHDIDSNPWSYSDTVSLCCSGEDKPPTRLDGLIRYQSNRQKYLLQSLLRIHVTVAARTRFEPRHRQYHTRDDVHNKVLTMASLLTRHAQRKCGPASKFADWINILLSEKTGVASEISRKLPIYCKDITEQIKQSESENGSSSCDTKNTNKEGNKRKELLVSGTQQLAGCAIVAVFKGSRRS